MPGDEVARRKLDVIENTVLGLAQSPHIVSLRGEISPGLRSILTVRKGVACFAVDDERLAARSSPSPMRGGNGWAARDEAKALRTDRPYFALRAGAFAVARETALSKACSSNDVVEYGSGIMERTHSAWPPPTTHSRQSSRDCSKN